MVVLSSNLPERLRGLIGGGLTWTKSKVPSAGVIAGQALVRPNGTVVMPIDNASETAIESFVSTNGGVSYAGPFAA